MSLIKCDAMHTTENHWATILGGKTSCAMQVSVQWPFCGLLLLEKRWNAKKRQHPCSESKSNAKCSWRPFWGAGGKKRDGLGAGEDHSMHRHSQDMCKAVMRVMRFLKDAN